jgi:hypothetical protein
MNSKKEVWKAIEFKSKKPSVRYAVSNHGRFGVMNDRGGVEVRSFRPQNNGHRYNYKIDGKSHSLFVHKEVAKAFVKKPSARHSLIIRKDHNYNNASAENLQWVTRSEHRAHVSNSPLAIRSRKKRAITESPTAKVFDAKTVREVKRLIWDPKRKLTYKQIARKYGVSEMQIYRMKSGELWYHIRVENEPLHKKYKENSENIQWLEKQGRKSHSEKKEKKKKKKAERKLEKVLKKLRKKEKKNKKKKH